MKKFKKIYIEITNVCNLNCKFCPSLKRKKEFMNINDFNLVINKIKDYTNMICLHVKGEPLMHPNIDEILNICNENNLLVNITTNATLLLNNVEIIKKYGCVRQINISMHSINQNENIDPIKYLDSVFNAVNKLKENNNLYISYRLWNLTDIKLNDINKNVIKRLQDEYKVSDLINKAKENDFIKLDNNIFLNQDKIFVWPDINGVKINEKGRCLALKDQVAILVDGTLVPCCLDENANIPLGNIFKENLTDILNKELSKKIKENFENNIITCKLCATCGFLKRLEEKRD